MTTGQVQQLIDAVKSASPAIWAAAQHQVQAQITQDWIWIAIFALVSVVSGIVIGTGVFLLRSSNDRYDDSRFAGALMIVLASIAFITALVFLGAFVSDLIAKTQASDYAAIKNLTDLIPAPPHQ